MRWQDELQELLDRDNEFLIDPAITSTEWMLEKLNVRNERIKASEIGGVEGEASKLIASICRALGATSYLTGTGALAYLDEGDFTEIGCEVMVQQWTPFSDSDLSTLDLLLNSPDQAVELISAAGDWDLLTQSRKDAK